MPAAMVDTSYPFSDRAMRLCRLIGNPLADALPTRLWCWGIDTDREDGRFESDANQLAQIVRFFDNPELLLRAFIECEVITPTGNSNEYRINGWRINARFFKERKRLRNLWKGQKKRAADARRTREKREADARVTSDPYPIPSSSSKALENTGADGAGGELPPKREIKRDRMGDHIAGGMWQAAEQRAGLYGLPLNEREQGMIGGAQRVTRECGIDFDRALGEWFRPEWKAAFGWGPEQFAKNIRKVLNTLKDPSLRPRLPVGEAPEPQAPKRSQQDRKAEDEARKQRLAAEERAAQARHDAELARGVA